MKNQLLKDFENAVAKANSYEHPLPADLLLKFYALYKIATNNNDNPKSDVPLINAFKANALIQAKNLDRNTAMESYINLVEKELK